MSEFPNLPERPEAHAIQVDKIVRDARRGRIRVPDFQRGIQWRAEDVRMLFDSVFRGYPIGSLLMWRRQDLPPGPARLGPLTIENPDATNVRWLVDGQQRVTALTLALSPDGAGDKRFDVWFDPDTQSFSVLDRDGPERHWFPVRDLIDAAELGERLLSWPPGLEDKRRRRVLLEAGKRLREYAIPVYVMEADEPVLREVFRRINHQGRGLSEFDVFHAVVRDRQGGLQGMELLREGASNARTGWGTLKDGTLLAGLLANEGLDPTRGLDGQAEADLTDTLQGSVDRVAPALRAAIAFLRDDAHIPHRNLLPGRLPLVILPAFFSRHPQPSARTRRLLVRWVWRGIATGALSLKARRRVQAGTAAALLESEEHAVGALLGQVPRSREGVVLAMNTRLADDGLRPLPLLALAHLEPRHVGHHGVLELPSLLNQAQGRAVQRLHESANPLTRTVANRVLHPEHPDVLGALRELAQESVTSPVLASHAIPPSGAHALLEGDMERFLASRMAGIERVVRDRIAAYAEWDADDSGSLRALLSDR